MPGQNEQAACIFCRLAEREREFFAYQDERVVVFPVLHPRAAGHLVVAPREHYRNASDLPEDLAGHVMAVGARMGQLLRRELGCTGILLAMNNEPPGQVVFHAHLHVIPRREGDFLDGEKPPEADRSELRALAARLRAALASG